MVGGLPRLGQFVVPRQHPARVSQRGGVVLRIGVRIEPLGATRIRLDRINREEAGIGRRVVPRPQIGQSGLVVALLTGPGEETTGGGRWFGSSILIVDIVGT